MHEAQIPSAGGPSVDDKTGLAGVIARDRDFAVILREFGPPPSRRRPEGFGTLAQIIVGQQVSVAAAAAIWQRMTDGLTPITPDVILASGDDGLRQFGLSRPKVRYLQALAHDLIDGRLDLIALRQLDDEAAIEHLVQVKGIGRWTAEIYLLAALGRADIWPGADIALMTATQDLKGLVKRPKADELRQLAAMWKPYRTFAARLLWHYYGMKRGRGGAPLTDK